MEGSSCLLMPIGVVRSSLRSLEHAPKQGSEGAPEAWIEVKASFAGGLDGVSPGQDLVLISWLHLASRSVLKTHPRADTSRPMTGVFSTRSPNRPNPLGLHRVKVLEVAANRLRVAPLEAIDGTPIVDIKVALAEDSPG